MLIREVLGAALSNGKKILLAQFDLFDPTSYPSPDESHNILLLRLWALINGASIAFGRQEMDWYAAHIIMLMKDLDLATSSEVETELCKFLWTPGDSGIFLGKTWPELEHVL